MTLLSADPHESLEGGRPQDGVPVPRSAPVLAAADNARSPLPPVCFVIDANVGDDVTTMVIEAGDRTLHELVVVTPVGDAALPAAAADGSPLAVRIEMLGTDRSAAEVACSCVVAAPRGAQRIELSLAAALGLVGAGVHGVVTSSSRPRP